MNYKNMTFIQFYFNWLNNLKFMKCRKSNFLFEIFICRPWTWPRGAAAPPVPLPVYVTTSVNLLKPSGYVMHQQV
jgi:hypothetical protein